MASSHPHREGRAMKGQRLVIGTIAALIALTLFVWGDHRKNEVARIQLEAGIAEVSATQNKTISALRAELAGYKEQIRVLQETHEQKFENVVRTVTEGNDAFAQLGSRLADVDVRLARFAGRTEVSDAARDTEVDELRGIIVGLRQDVNALVASVRGTTEQLHVATEAEAHVRLLQDEMTTMSATLQRVSTRDTHVMYERMIAPTVQVMCGLDVGAGTIIACRHVEGSWRGYVLTAFHIVAGAEQEKPDSITVTVYRSGGTRAGEMFEAELVSSKECVDLALLEIEMDTPSFIAHLALRESLRTIEVFTRVYAVGCPLGEPPLQTGGELSSKRKVLLGETYWMVSAPTIFGNSGGGIYLAESGELIGVLSRVSAYNNIVNIAVAHMGIFVPATEIYTWLNEEGYAFVYDPALPVPEEDE